MFVSGERAPTGSLQHALLRHALRRRVAVAAARKVLRSKLRRPPMAMGRPLCILTTGRYPTNMIRSVRWVTQRPAGLQRAIASVEVQVRRAELTIRTPAMITAHAAQTQIV